MNQILMAFLLIPMALKDIKIRQIHAGWMLGIGSVGMLWNLICNGWGWYEIISGICIGMVLIGVSRVTDSIGLGDGILFLAVGLISGWEQCITLLMGGLCLLLPVGIFLWLVKHKSKNYEIPFVPFVLAAWIGQLF